MPHPHSVSFCVSYAVCLGLISVVAVHSMRRFRHPFTSFVLALAALGATFWFALWLEAGLVQTGQAGYQMGLPYHHFIRADTLGPACLSRALRQHYEHDATCHLTCSVQFVSDRSDCHCHGCTIAEA